MRSRPFSMTGNSASNIEGDLHIDVPLGSRKKKNVVKADELEKSWSDKARQRSIEVRRQGRLPVQPLKSERLSFPVNPTVASGLRAAVAQEPFKSYDEYPVESIAAKDIATAEQRTVSPKTVSNYMSELKDSGEFSDKPYGVRYKNKVWVQDGHHRVEAALRSGRDSVKMHVQTIGKIAKRANTLYVNRPVLNADEIIAWAKSNGFQKCVPPEEMHVTCAFSKKPLEWPEPVNDEISFMPAEPAVEWFGPDNNCAVLTFESQTLFNRWKQLCELGASWSWPDYTPHITLSYNAALTWVPGEIKPYTGKIVLGPEEFSEVTEGWGDSIIEKFDPSQARAKDGKWTEETSADPSKDGILVYRLGSEQGGLGNRNAGNLRAVAAHMTRLDDFEKPQPKAGAGNVISVYRTKLPKDVGAYQTINARGGAVKAVGRSAEKQSDGKQLISYSFPEGHEHERVGHASLADVHSELKTMGYANADDAGNVKTEEALRTVLNRVKKGADMDDDFLEQDRIQKRGARNNKADKAMIQQMHDHACALGADCQGLEDDLTPRDDSYDKVARIAKIDESLGLVFGYAIVCSKDGKPYYDLNIDKAEDGTLKRVPEHIPEDAMLKAAVDFAKTARVGNEMHSGPDTGEYVFVFPMTTDIAKAFGIETHTTGLMIAYKPTPDVFAKFKDGTYTGFSIEGRRVSATEVE